MITPTQAPPGRNGHAPPGALPTGGDPLEYLSVSRLKSFLSCRLKFYFEKVLRLPTPTSPSLHLGRAVHVGLQHHNKARWRGGDASETAVVGAYHAAFDHPDDGQPVSYAGPEEETVLREKGESLLRHYLAVSPSSRTPMGVELTLRAEPPGLALPLLGVIDLVEDDLTPVDYKTVASTPQLELEGWLHQLQLTAYTLLVEDATGEPCPGARLVYLVKTKTPKIVIQDLPPPDEAARDRFLRLAEAYVNGVANENYYPSPGLACGWCAFRSKCSAWKGGPS